MTYNRKLIAITARDLVNAHIASDFSDGMKKAWENAHKVATMGDWKTYVEWLSLGKEVLHGSQCKGKITVWDAKTSTGTRVLAYFAEEQTCNLGEQA